MSTIQERLARMRQDADTAEKEPEQNDIQQRLSAMRQDAQTERAMIPNSGDRLMDLALETVNNRAGVSRVAPGMPGGGGRGYSTVADLDPSTATPGDYMAAIARDQIKGYTDSRIGQMLTGAMDTANAGYINAAGTLADLVQRYNIGSYYNNAEDWIRATEQAKEAPSWNFVNQAHEKADILQERGSQEIANAKNGLGLVGRILVDAGVSGTQMIGDAAINAVLPGMGLAAMGVRSFGSSAGEARREGAEVGEQALYGLTNAAVEVLSEKIGDVPGIYGGGWIDDAVKKVTQRWASNPLLYRAAMAAASGLGESIEEFAAGLIEPGLKSIYNDKGYFQNYTPEDWADMGNAMASAFLLGGVSGGLSPNAGYTQDIADYQAPQQQTEQTQAEQTQPAVQQTEMPPATDQQPAQPITQAMLRSIAEDPEQLAALGIDTKGKSNSQVREEIRAMLLADRAVQEQAQRTSALAQQNMKKPTELGWYGQPGTESVAGETWYSPRQTETEQTSGAEQTPTTEPEAPWYSTKPSSNYGNSEWYQAAPAAQAETQTVEEIRTGTIIDYANANEKSGEFSPTMADTMRTFYSPMQEPAAYMRGMTATYNAGIKGVPMESVNAPGITLEQKQAAYIAGQAAATVKARSAAQPQSAPAQQTVQQPSAPETTAQAQKKPAVRAESPGLDMESVKQSKAKLTRAETRGLDAVGKLLGVEIRMTNEITDDNGKRSGAQGKYKDGVVQISTNAKDPYLTVAVHEVVHRVRELSPEAYDSLLRVVKNNLGAEGMKKSELVRSLGYDEGTDLTEEVVADAFGIMQGDEKFIRQFVQEDRNAAQKFLDALHDMLVKIQRALSGGPKLDPAQRAEFSALENKLITMSSVFEDALKTASEAYETNGGKPAPAEVSSDFAEAKYSVAPPYRPNSAALESWVKEMSDEASETYSLFNDVNQIGGDVSRRFMLPSEWNEKVRTDKAFAETARKIAERVPENIRKNAHINEDGTITETAFEKEFRMERSIMQRLVDSLPMETIPSTVESNGKRIRISEKGKVNTVGGEAYRRALLDERRKMYREGRLPTKSISGLSKDTWGAMGFLATNGKTGASGDFTTLCPQMYYNKGCFYCYRRAALTTGVNNKLVGENVWYTGEVLQLKQGDIDNLNKNGGLRIQSFGDWMEQYSSQLADLLMDAEEVGLQVKIITKEPSLIDTVALLRDQGIGKNLYFNLSTDYTIEEQGAINNRSGDGAQPRNPFRPYMTQEDGRTFWKRALSVEEANEYRKKYPWVNTRIVATTVDEFLEGLRSPMVDVVTGYHGNIRQFERVSSATGETLLQVEALGDAGMPRFSFNQKTGQWTLEYEGKTATHKKLARAIEDAGLQMQYYIKSCCITGRCATCEGKCGKVARDFNVKNATNADKQSVAYWQKHMTSAEDNPLLLDQMEDDQTKALLDAELARGKYSKSTKELLEAYVEQYGAIKPGEKPAREVTMPKRTAPKTKVSMTARTVAEAGATPESFVPTIENLAANHEFDYTPYSDEAAISNAAQIAARKGWSRTLTDWSKEVSDGGVSKTNTAVGWALYNNAVNSGDTETTLNVLNLIVKHQRNAAQAVQATRILKQLNPETQLYNAENVVADINEDLKKRLGKDAPEVEIDPDLAEQFLRAKKQEDRDKVMTRIFQNIGRQMPTTFLDRWTAWRYTAMLGNPRTIVRNVVGNAGFAPVVWTKDAIATAIEAAASAATGGKFERKKGNIIGRGDLLEAAWKDYANVQEEAMGQSKYSDRQAANKEIQDARKIFGNTKSKVWNKTGGAVLEGWRKGTNFLMDKTDVIFNKPQYVLAMAQYCAANGISAEQIRSGKGLEKARAYAAKEAQKATYRDANDFSQMVSSLGKSWLHSDNAWKRGIATLGEGVLPFRKTPANILARGVEYSPIGLIKSLTYDAVQVKKGNMSAADMIDDISAGLTGTGLLALGVYLAAQGLLRGRGRGDDKKKEFADLEGHQDYALEIGDTSITLDWLAPEALPVFIGANLWEAASDRKDGMQMKDILTAISNVSEPMLQMSMLQSLNDLLDGNAYGNEETSALMRKLSSAATSYLTQAFPTLLGQVERTGEGKRMTTYTDKNGFLTGDMQYILGKISAKIPGWDFQQIPYIDAWGREELTGKFLERAGQNFVNPSFVSKIVESDMEKELERLYDSTGESVFPQRAEKYFNVDGERKDLSAKEYVTYATEKGRTSYTVVGGMVESDLYKGLNDDEKATCVKEAYTYANQTSRTAAGGKITESWVEKAQAGVSRGIKPETYILVKNAVSDVEALKDKNGNSISNSKGLQIMQTIYSIPGLTYDQRKYLFECFGVGKTVIGYNKALVDQKLKEMKQK